MKIENLLGLLCVLVICGCERKVNSNEILGTYVFNYVDESYENLSDSIFISKNYKYEHIGVFEKGNIRKTIGVWEETEKGVCFTNFKFFIPGYDTADTTIYGYWCPKVYKNLDGEICITISSDQEFYYKKIPH